MSDNLVITKSLVGSSTDNCIIEQENGYVETMAGSIASVGIPTEDMVGQLWDELYVFTREARNHTRITQSQKQGGFTAAEEQAQVFGISEEW